MSKKLVAQFDITMPVDEMQVIPSILKAGHPVDEKAHKDFLENWKARGLVVEEETDEKPEEGQLQTTIGGGENAEDALSGKTDESELEDGVARPQLSEDGSKVLVPGGELEDSKPAKKATK